MRRVLILLIFIPLFVCSRVSSETHKEKEHESSIRKQKKTISQKKSRHQEESQRKRRKKQELDVIETRKKVEYREKSEISQEYEVGVIGGFAAIGMGGSSKASPAWCSYKVSWLPSIDAVEKWSPGLGGGGFGATVFVNRPLSKRVKGNISVGYYLENSQNESPIVWKEDWYKDKYTPTILTHYSSRLIPVEIRINYFPILILDFAFITLGIETGYFYNGVKISEGRNIRVIERRPSKSSGIISPGLSGGLGTRVPLLGGIRWVTIFQISWHPSFPNPLSSFGGGMQLQTGISLRL